jgi:hypothetical protein
MGMAAIAFAAMMTFAATAPALAAKGGGGGKPPTGSTSTLKLVPLNSSDDLPHYGQQVTFDVSSTATTEPHVSLSCYQGGTLVYGSQTGYYASYPWPWTQTMTLASNAWTGGAADCTARLYYINITKTVTLSTLNFHAYA